VTGSKGEGRLALASGRRLHGCPRASSRPRLPFVRQVGLGVRRSRSHLIPDGAAAPDDGLGRSDGSIDWACSFVLRLADCWLGLADGDGDG